MDKRKELLTAARKVFAEDGYNGATITKIAKEANLKAPSLLYWYFSNKQELFKAAIQDFSPILNQLSNLWEEIDSPPEEILSRVANAILSTLDSPGAVQFFSIIISEVPRNPELANNAGEKLFLGLNFLVAYLDRQVELGRLRPHNTQSSARAFLGSFITYLLTREFFLPVRTGLPDTASYADDIVSIYLKGLLNTSPEYKGESR